MGVARLSSLSAFFLYLHQAVASGPSTPYRGGGGFAVANSGGTRTSRRAGERPMHDAFSEVAELDDFQVIAERRQVSETIATLIDRYRKLNEEMARRATLRWMLP
jgi:hypothetical protein